MFRNPGYIKSMIVKTLHDCEVYELPTTYLGLPLVVGYKSNGMLKPLITVLDKDVCK